jgi:hypothetical protein
MCYVKFVTSALFLRRLATGHSVLQTRHVSKESLGTYRISMDTIPSLETIVQFHSYERYKILHTERWHLYVSFNYLVMV